MLRIDCDRLGYERNFTIYADSDQMKVIGDILKDMGMNEKNMPKREMKERISNAKNKSLNPEQFLSLIHISLLLADGEPIGELGAIHPKVQKAWGIPEKVYYAEINVEKLRAHKGGKRTYEPLPRFPKVPRDIAVVVDETVSAAAVKEAIEQAPAAVAIGDVELFDVYRGAGIPAGKKSMAYSFALSASCLLYTSCLKRLPSKEAISAPQRASSAM